MVLNSGHGIDPGRVDIAVSQYIRQVKKILPFFPEHPGKKVAEVMGEYLIRTDSGCGTDGFHLRPYITAVQWIPEAADEHTSLTDPFFSAVFEQFLPQLLHQIHLSFLSLAGNLCFPLFTAATVIYFNSLIRIPVAPMVSMMSAVCSRPIR